MRKRTMITAALVTFALVGGIALYLTTSPTAGRPIPAQKPTRSATPVASLTSEAAHADLQLVRELVRRYTDAINRDDNATVAQLTCAGETPTLLQIAAAGRDVRFTGEVDRTKDPDRVFARVMIGGVPAARVRVERRGGSWCVAE